MKPLYIFDLDGTLADLMHRRHYVESPSKNWAKFFEACVHDVPIPEVIDTMHRLIDSGADVWIFSGRSDEVREQTIGWLHGHTRFYESQVNPTLRMRKAGDYTPDDRLKKHWYTSMAPTDKQRLVAVFDDRDRIVRMWREQGVRCFQVADGDF